MKLQILICLTAALALPFAASTGAAEEPAPKPARVVRAAPPPAEMARLEFLHGTWLNKAVFYDREGNEAGRFDAATDLPGGAAGNTIAPALGGWILESGAGTPYGRSWFRYEPRRGEYMLVAADFQGNFDILAGGFEGDELVFVEIAPKPHRDGGTIMWRWTYYDIGEGSFSLRQAYSRDEGQTWTLANRQVNRRVEG